MGNGIGAYYSCLILLLLIITLTPSITVADNNRGIAPTNTELWRFEIGERVFLSPAVSNSVIYVGGTMSSYMRSIQ